MSQEKKCEACDSDFSGPPVQRFCSLKCANTSHGGKGTRLYATWQKMRERCNKTYSPRFAYYGGRGIKVCAEWDNSFVAFREWSLANGYQDGLTIDRKDSNGNYEPNNCRWATMAQQNYNKRKMATGATSQFKGVSLRSRSGKFEAQIACNGRSHTIGAFASEEDAALAYDAKARELFGEFAVLNFPLEVR